MFTNIGEKIKGLAKVACVIEAVALVITGMVFIVSGDAEKPLIGFCIMTVGPILAWVSSWLLYGFGELIEKTCEIARNTCREEGKSEAQPKVVDERIEKIERLRSQGLITEEEYKRAISKTL